MSVSRCEVVALALCPSGESFPHQIDGAHTTPSRTLSDTRAMV